jgi:alkylation response protein AidB-like acyl-CoA dehydrogenase
MAALADAGVFKMRVPLRYGGYESDSATLYKVISELAQADGSVAWNTAVWSVGAWVTCMYPDHVQDEVFADPQSRVCAVLSPTAQAAPASGGLVVNGRWHFISGAWHSNWQAVMAMAPTPDGASLWPVIGLVPMKDLQIDDDWDTAGLRGTGSVSTIASDVFIPADKVLPVPVILQGQYASALNAGTPLYRQPMMSTGCTSFTGTAIGLAKAAREVFVSRLDRALTYTSYPSQREAAVTHLQLADATLKIEEAESHAATLAAIADSKAPGQDWTMEERIRARAYLGRVFQLGKDAVRIIADASGGTSIYNSLPIQRISADIHALSMHALMHPTTSLELYGRVLSGVEPNTMYV